MFLILSRLVFVFYLLSPAGAALAAEKSLESVLSESKDFRTFLRALKLAGLMETLQRKGPLTVFAPTQRAFDRIEPKALDALFKNQPELARVMKYHFYEGRFSSQDWASLQNKGIVSLEGSQANLKFDGPKLKIDFSLVTKADIAASNGLVHAIDTVLVPVPPTKP